MVGWFGVGAAAENAGGTPATISQMMASGAGSRATACATTAPTRAAAVIRPMPTRKMACCTKLMLAPPWRRLDYTIANSHMPRRW